MKIHSPEEVGMSSSRLERITPVMEGFVKDNRLPGIMTLVQRRGEVVHLGKYGLMDIENNKPIQEDGLFRIYSMTKPIVSVALMMLYEEGRFSLSDPVSEFIPAFGKTMVNTGSTSLGLKLVEQEPVMTIHHLLTHTAGLSYGWFFDSPVEELYRTKLAGVFDRGKTLQTAIEQLAQLPLLYQPGTQWRYSRATDVLGHVVEIISGKPLPDFLDERIFGPLGMIDTGFHVPEEKLDRLAQIYVSPKLYGPVVPKPEDIGIGDVTVPTQCPSGGGGLISTLADYLRFCQCLIQDGRYEGGRLLGRKTLAWMTTNHLPGQLMPLKIGPFPLDGGFGLGFRVVTSLGEARTVTSVGEYSWVSASKTTFWIDPAEELIGLMMTQHMPTKPYPVRERFKILVYQAIAD